MKIPANVEAAIKTFQAFYPGLGFIVQDHNQEGSPVAFLPKETATEIPKEDSVQVSNFSPSVIGSEQRLKACMNVVDTLRRILRVKEGENINTVAIQVRADADRWLTR